MHGSESKRQVKTKDNIEDQVKLNDRRDGWWWIGLEDDAFLVKKKLMGRRESCRKDLFSWRKIINQ